MNDNNTIIGSATLIYNEDGTLKQGYFTPTMKIDLDDETIGQLYGVPCQDSEQIRNHSELIISNWFNKMTEIELTDRIQYKIVSKIINCTMYSEKQVKSCIIEFSLQSLS